MPRLPARRQPGEVGKETIIGAGQGFRKDARLCQNGYKVRVTPPPGQHMHMEMVGNPGAGRPTEVEPKIEPLRLVFCLQSHFADPGEADNLLQLLVFCLFQEGDVAFRHDQEMAGGIRE